MPQLTLRSGLTGFLLGGKPRQQAIGHVIEIFAGALAATPLFFLLFLPPDAIGMRSVSTIASEQFALPGALQWKGVADRLGALPWSAIVSMIVAAVSAAVVEIAKLLTRGRLPLSSVPIGLGVVLPPASTLSMWAGALIFWWSGRRNASPGTKGHEFWVEGCEPICAGLISGSALVCIGNAIVNVLI